MKKNPLISVVVPVYNVEKYLPQCLSSLVCQTYKNLEIICIDDGSPDNSIKILRDFAKKDKRIKIIRQKNSGLSTARNAGMAMSKGEFVHFFDSDDYISVNFYEKMLAAATITGADMTACSVDRFMFPGEDRVSVEPNAAFVSLSEKFQRLRLYRYAWVWRYLFRRDFLEKCKVRFIPGIVLEDMMFIPEIVKKANMVATASDALYFYVQRPNSITNVKKTEKFLRDERAAKKYMARFIEENGILIPRYKDETYSLFGRVPLFTRRAYDKSTKPVRYFFLGIPVFFRKHKIIGTNRA